VESTSVLQVTAVVRATGCAGSLGRFPSLVTSPSSPERKWRQWGARVPASGPLHRCVQAGSWVLGQYEWRLDWRLPGASVLGSYCSLPRGVTLGGAVAWEITPRVRFTRSIGVLGQCIWLQKSVRGVWPREATSVAAGVGDGGLASGFGKPPRSETASGTRSSGDGWSVEGSAEDHLLAKGVSDRGKPSAFTG
jgi:hypothetical protein